MNIDDFRYMVRGRVTGVLPSAEAGLLLPFERVGPLRRRALLMLHGFSSSPAVFRRMTPELMMYDAVLCPLLSGHGESIDVFSEAHASDWLEQSVSLCERLITEYDEVHVMGMSLGGLLACHLAARFPVHHLYLLAPALSLCLNVPFALNGAKLLSALGLRRIRNRAGNLVSSAHPELAYRQVPLSAIIEILTLIRDFKGPLPNCPVDLFLGSKDTVVNSARVAAQFINCPNTKIHWLTHSAHVLPLDTDVDDILNCLRAQ